MLRFLSPRAKINPSIYGKGSASAGMSGEIMLILISLDGGSACSGISRNTLLRVKVSQKQNKKTHMFFHHFKFIKKYYSPCSELILIKRLIFFCLESFRDINYYFKKLKIVSWDEIIQPY